MEEYSAEYNNDSNQSNNQAKRTKRYEMKWVFIPKETNESKKNIKWGFNLPIAANEPAAKSNESPGNNGIITNPVSAKIIRKRIA